MFPDHGSPLQALILTEIIHIIQRLNEKTKMLYVNESNIFLNK